MKDRRVIWLSETTPPRYRDVTTSCKVPDGAGNCSVLRGSRRPRGRGGSSSKAGAYRGERLENQASRAAARHGISLLRGAIAQAHGFFDPAMCLQTLFYPSKVVGLEIGTGQLSQHR